MRLFNNVLSRFCAKLIGERKLPDVVEDGPVRNDPLVSANRSADPIRACRDVEVDCIGSRITGDTLHGSFRDQGAPGVPFSHCCGSL
jgi:hypothetical protein